MGPPAMVCIAFSFTMLKPYSPNYYHNRWRCLLQNLIYKALVKVENNETFHYFGQTSTPFKERFSHLLTSFKKATKRKFSVLSQFIWNLKLKDNV